MKKISKIPSPLVSLIITITVNRVYLRFTSSKIPSPLVSLIITITVNRVYLRFTSHYRYFQLRTQALIFRVQAQVFPILYRNLEPVSFTFIRFFIRQITIRNVVSRRSQHINARRPTSGYEADRETEGRGGATSDSERNSSDQQWEPYKQLHRQLQ
ncbi:hypothetical protein M378DRAFT_18320 [Amanita muscaria Koide BX008]|uniref:Uncharacterized protein n=1 Tax=Amanita muscaria (strain Koide BX008) TaxID=946122 RepID=A0A0C2SM64_AMAMK|nr:hypothetical protein M378DRAFT_18320 [Amanita muscaria Koide BX008]